MSYTPPLRSAVDFAEDSGPYSPPTSTSVNFADDDGGPVDDVFGALGVVLTLAFSAEGWYDNAVNRNVTSTVESAWSRAKRSELAIYSTYTSIQSAQPAASIAWTRARPVQSNVQSAWRRRQSSSRHGSVSWGHAAPLGISRSARYQTLHNVRRNSTLPWDSASDISRSAGVRYQTERIARNQTALAWQAARIAGVATDVRAGGATRANLDTAIPWQFYRRPSPGRRPRGSAPEGPPCYVPPWGDQVDLVFDDDMLGITDLVFACVQGGIVNPGTVVVPVRRVYMVFNEFALFRWPDLTPVPASSLSMTLDVDSWAWSFQASIPGYALPLVEAAGGEAAVLRAVINGSPFHWRASSLSRERTFGQASVRVGGMSVVSTLDAPASPNINYLQSEDRTIRQLIDDVLSYNGVTLGVPVEFDMDDWLVPSGTFSHAGSYIAAVQTLAAAGGGYVQPHDTDLALRIRHRYPYLPRDWASDVTPDFILPSDVTTREGIQWSSAPAYNRIHLEGSSFAEVTVSGEMGDVIAPSVVDPLLTAPAGWLQRARAGIGEGGRRAMVDVSLPVLPTTGIIRPGQWVSYVDGLETRLGLVRSVSVQVAMPSIIQTLSLETR